MAVQKGKDLLLKIDNGAGFETVAGLRATRLSFNAETVDVTSATSAGRWRELLAGAGLRSASISGSGVFLDASSDAVMQSAFFNALTPDCQVAVPDFGVVEGAFQITALEYSGQHDGEAVYEVALASAGELTFVAG
ncbi:MAG: phage major tail protein, TP901-1 family [Pseudomonadota bacterium]